MRKNMEQKMLPTMLVGVETQDTPSPYAEC